MRFELLASQLHLSGDRFQIFRSVFNWTSSAVAGFRTKVQATLGWTIQSKCISRGPALWYCGPILGSLSPFLLESGHNIGESIYLIAFKLQNVSRSYFAVTELMCSQLRNVIGSLELKRLS